MDKNLFAHLREGSLFINGGIRTESRGARKNATRFEGGRKKIIFFIF